MATATEETVRSVTFESLSGVHTRIVELPVKNTDEERIALNAELAQVDREIITVTDEKAATAKKYGEQLKELKGRQEEILEQIEGGITKPVHVEVGYDWAAGKKFMRRRDTGELLPEEAITDRERQLNLEGVEPKDFEPDQLEMEGFDVPDEDNEDEPEEDDDEISDDEIESGAEPPADEEADEEPEL